MINYLGKFEEKIHDFEDLILSLSSIITKKNNRLLQVILDQDNSMKEVTIHDITHYEVFDHPINFLKYSELNHLVENELYVDFSNPEYIEIPEHQTIKEYISESINECLEDYYNAYFKEDANNLILKKWFFEFIEKYKIFFFNQDLNNFVNNNSFFLANKKIIYFINELASSKKNLHFILPLVDGKAYIFDNTNWKFLEDALLELVYNYRYEERIQLVFSIRYFEGHLMSGEPLSHVCTFSISRNLFDHISEDEIRKAWEYDPLSKKASSLGDAMCYYSTESFFYLLFQKDIKNIYE